MDLSEADYMKMLNYIASTSSHKLVRREDGHITIVPLKIPNGLTIDSYIFYPTAKACFRKLHGIAHNVINGITVDLDSLEPGLTNMWRLFSLSVDALCIEADLYANA